MINDLDDTKRQLLGSCRCANTKAVSCMYCRAAAMLQRQDARLVEAERQLKQYRDDMVYRMLGGDDAARDRADDSASDREIDDARP